MVWGAVCATAVGENLRRPLSGGVSRGRKVAAYREYLRWNSGFGSHQQWLVSTGRTPLISVTSKREDGTPVSWRSIA